MSIEAIAREHLEIVPSTIGAKIAAGLAILYLPPLPPPVLPVSTPRRAPKQLVLSHPVPKKPQRTSLKQEIELATALYKPPVSFNTRGDFDLKRVVEDQVSLLLTSYFIPPTNILILWCFKHNWVFTSAQKFFSSVEKAIT